MVARQSKMAIKNHNTEHRVKRHTHKPGSPHQSESESEVAQLCLTVCYPWTVAHQAPPSVGFSRQEYWSGLPFPSPGDLLDPGIEPRSLTLQNKHQRFQGRKVSQVERRGRRRERGQKGWPYRRLLPPTDTQALRDFSLGFQRREDWNSALPEIRTRI